MTGLQHPGLLLQQELTKRGITQKQFAQMMDKKISEVNELIKGKRNITIPRDILLAIVLDDPEKKWIALQINYDYELTKRTMADKIKELSSKRKKTKEREVFEDF